MISTITFALRCALGVAAMILALRLPVKRFAFDDQLLEPFHVVTTLSLVGSAALAVAWVRHGRRCLQALERVPAPAIALVLFSLTVWMVHDTTVHAFAGVPQIQDEIAFDLLARNIANGAPIPASHPLSEFFRLRFVIDDGHVYPLFQPGWPAFLALARTLHVNAWAPAIATALLVVATFRLGERVHGRATGLLAALLLLASPFVHYLGGSYFSHALAAALFVLVLERAFATVQAVREGRQRQATTAAIAGGALCALLVVTRVQTAVAACLPLVGLAGFVLYREPRARRPVAWFVGVALLGPLLQMGWNVATTHHAFELPQDRWFALTEANPDCHRLGFGPDIGCRREHPLDVPEGEDGFTFHQATAVTTLRWSVLRRDAWGTAIPFALVALVLLRRPAKRDVALIAAAAAPIILYFGFYYHAIDHGARLYLEVVPPLVVLLASAITLPIERPDRYVTPRIAAVLGGVALFLLVPIAIAALAHDLPERVAENGKSPQTTRITRNLDEAAVHHAVVYVVNCTDDADRADVVYGWSSVLDAQVPEAGDRMFARDFGPAHDQQLAAMFPDRVHVRADCEGRVVGRLTPSPAPRVLVSELEAKFPPDAVNGAYARIETDADASNGGVLTVTTTSPEARLAFRQYVFVGATYRVSALVRRRIDGGKLALSIDGAPLSPPIETRGPDDRTTWVATTTVRLEPGVHRLVLGSAGDEGKHSLDRLQFDAID